MAYKILLFKLERTCTACPSQWEYFDNNVAAGAYVRYRGGRFRVYANGFILNEFDLIDEENVVYSFIRKDQPYGGFMSDYEMRKILLKNNLCKPISIFQKLWIEYEGLKEFTSNYWHRKIGLPFYYKVWCQIFPSKIDRIFGKANTIKYLKKIEGAK
jgi:hypothetical protein